MTVPRLVLATLALLCAAAASVATAAGTAQDPAPAQRTRGALPYTKGGQPPKLQTSLARLSAAVEAYGRPGAEITARSLAVPLDAGKVRVVVEALDGRAENIARRAASLDIEVEATYGDLVQLLAPVESLATLAEHPAIGFIRRPLAWQPSVVGQGVSLTNADDWHAAGRTGAGIKVAVLDGGFSGYGALLGNELPASVTTHSCRADGDITGGGEAHGAGVAEIVSEMAPGAQLYLANFETDVEFATCVTWLTGQGVKVINFSAGFFGSGPGDGTGPINDVVTAAENQGVVWVNAAGNQAQAHWSGPWSDADADAFMAFSGADEGNTIAAIAGEVIFIIIKWDDPFGTSCNDYDLLLFNDALQIVAGSVDTQDCVASYPVEAMAYLVPATGNYHVGIGRYDANGLANFHVYSLVHNCPQMQYCVKGGSVIEPGDHDQALTVGAVRWSTPGTIETFSSRGPTSDGRTKPDVVAPDGVANATYGSFFGTSASAPHAAGAAALVRQWQPGWGPDQVRSFLRSGAVDLGAAGPDNVFGWGRLDLGAIQPSATPTPTATPMPKDPSGDTDGDTIPNSSDADDDNDGCTDVKELGLSKLLGGGRNPHSFWDFFDTPNASGLRDKAVNVIDIQAVVDRFGTTGSATTVADALAPPATGYHAAFDRTAAPGGLSGPADGSVGVIDIALLVGQFGHSCV